MATRNDGTDEAEVTTGHPDDERAAIQAISRATRMLGLFTSQKPMLSLNELTRLFGMGKATTHRYALSLRQCGLLNYDEDTARYSLGIRLVSMARIAQASVQVVEVAGPFLLALADELNETVALSVWDGEAAVVMRVAEAPRRTIYRGMRVGSRLRVDGAHYTVFAAFLKTNADNLELARVRQQKIAIRDGVDDDLRVLASPIFDGDVLVACVAINGGPRRLSADVDSPAAKSVKRCAAEISAAMSGSVRNSKNTGTTA